MSTFPKIVSALTQAFKTINDSDLLLSVSWPSMPFSIPTNAAWASFYVIPSEPSVATLGAGGEDEFTGVAQVGLNFPLQQGVGPINAAYETLRAYFVAGKFLTYSDATVTVLRCGVSPVKQSDSYLQVFVSIYWRARLARPII